MFVFNAWPSKFSYDSGSYVVCGMLIAHMWQDQSMMFPLQSRQLYMRVLCTIKVWPMFS